MSPEPGAAATASRLARIRALARNTRLRWVWSGLSVIIVVALGYWVLRQLAWSELRQALAQADLRWIAVAAGAIVAGEWLRLWRAWRLLQRTDAPRVDANAVTWDTAARATLGAQVINWLSPIRLGDVWRVWQLRQSQPAGVLWCALAILIEKSLDSIALALIALALLLTPVPANTSSTALRLAMTAGAGLLLISAVLAFRPATLQRQLLRRFPQLIEGTLNATQWRDFFASRALVSPRKIAAAGLVSALMWGGAALTNIALAQAFHIPWQGWMIPLLVVGIQTVSIVSPVPGNVGVIPLVTIGVFSLAGLSSASALGLAHGTVHYLLVYAVNLIWFLWMQLKP